MSSIYDLSVTAASNTTIDSVDVSGATGKVKDGDNVMRSLGAFMAQGWQDLGGAKTTAGSANAHTVTLASGFSAYAANQVFTVKFGYTNTSSTVNLNVNSIGNARVKVNYDGVLADPIPGDLRAGAYGNFIYDGTYFVLLNAQQQARYAPGTLYGLTPTTPGANTISLAVGSARDAADSANMDVTSAITAKDITSAWSVGSSGGLLDTGSVANTTYYVWLIKRPDTGVVDFLGSTSSSAPTMPTNYSIKRLLGYFVRSGGTNGTPIWYGPPVDLEGTTTPTITATSGSFTTVSCSLRYTKIGNLVIWNATITITNAGTATGGIVVPLPYAPIAAASAYGRETGSSGYAASAQITSGTATCTVFKYDNGTLIGTGNVVTVGGSYFV